MYFLSFESRAGSALTSFSTLKTSFPSDRENKPKVNTESSEEGLGLPGSILALEGFILEETTRQSTVVISDGLITSSMVGESCLTLPSDAALPCPVTNGGILGDANGIADRGVAGMVRLWNTGFGVPGSPMAASIEKPRGIGEFGGLSTGLGELGRPGLGNGALTNVALIRAVSVSGDSLWDMFMFMFAGPGVRGMCMCCRYCVGGDRVGGAVRGPLPTNLLLNGRGNPPTLSSGVACQLSSLSQVACVVVPISS
jgi:hypothetical protein